MTPIKRILLLAALVAAGYALKVGVPSEGSGVDSAIESTATAPSYSISADASSDSRLQQAFNDRESNLQIEGQGTVVNVLKDDTQGSPHQRFLLRTSTGQTILVAHNIELAPRVMDITEGDIVRFYGEYEWNDKGGVIHWTHHDPAGRHPGGWLEHRGQRYE